MQLRLWSLSVVAAMMLMAAGPCDAVTAEQTQTAINKAKAYLYSQLHDDNWELNPPPDRKALAAAPDVRNASDVRTGQWGGLTAICTYALLASGESPRNPQLAKAIEWLEKADIDGIYALGIRAQLWALLPMSPKVKSAAKADVRTFLTAMATQPPDLGFYGYHARFVPNGDFYHHSTAQYAVLGMWACEQASAEIPEKYWQIVDKAWRGTQLPDGGWAYRAQPDDHPESAAMTAAGIATLFIAEDHIHAGADSIGNGLNVPIDHGLKWFSDHFDQVNDLYAWYGVERIGVASGYKYFGSTDWFATGSARLIQSQEANGSWRYTGPLQPAGNADSLIGTSFAMLFLSRGRAPVVMNKLQYSIDGKPAHWNQRPRDAANFAHWAGRKFEADYNWQVLSLETPVEQLHDSPILYISGDQQLKFSAAEEDKLRNFVQQGGLILGNADHESAAFAKSFRELGQRLFPELAFRTLPRDHVIFTEEIKINGTPEVEGLSNGVRELFLLFSHGDPSRAWQSRANVARPDAFNLMADIVLYSHDRTGVRYKGDTYCVMADPSIHARKTVGVARIQYGAGWDPEPGGWIRLAAILHNEKQIDLDIHPVALVDGATQIATSGAAKSTGKLSDFKIAHLTGTAQVEWTEPQRAQLRAFVDGGGTLIIDAAGGSKDFADSAEKLIVALYHRDQQELQDVEAASPLYVNGKTELPKPLFRHFVKRDAAAGSTVPRLRAVTMNHRIAILYSRYDLSTGLVGQAVDGINGYTPAVATALMSNILMNISASDGSAPTAQAAP